MLYLGIGILLYLNRSINSNRLKSISIDLLQNLSHIKKLYVCLWVAMEYTDYAISDIRFNSITSLPAGLLENHLQLEILYVLLDITIIVLTSFRNIDGNPIPELPSDLLKSKHNLQQLYDFIPSNILFYLIISARYIPASLLLTFRTTFSTIASNCTKCTYQRDYCRMR